MDDLLLIHLWVKQCSFTLKNEKAFLLIHFNLIMVQIWIHTHFLSHITNAYILKEGNWSAILLSAISGDKHHQMNLTFKGCFLRVIHYNMTHNLWVISNATEWTQAVLFYPFRPRLVNACTCNNTVSCPQRQPLDTGSHWICHCCVWGDTYPI